MGMNIKLPEIIGKFNVIVNGVGNAGTVDEFQIPKQTPIKQGYKAGGLNAELQIPLGEYEPMETSFKLTGLGDTLLTSDESCSLDGTRIIFEAEAKSLSNCKNKKVKIILHGSIKEWDPGTIKKGEINVTNISLNIVYLHYTLEGKSILERDDRPGGFIKRYGVKVNN